MFDYFRKKRGKVIQITSKNGGEYKYYNIDHMSDNNLLKRYWSFKKSSLNGRLNVLSANNFFQFDSIVVDGAIVKVGNMRYDVGIYSGDVNYGDRKGHGILNGNKYSFKGNFDGYDFEGKIYSEGRDDKLIFDGKSKINTDNTFRKRSGTSYEKFYSVYSDNYKKEDRSLFYEIDGNIKVVIDEYQIRYFYNMVLMVIVDIKTKIGIAYNKKETFLISGIVDVEYDLEYPNITFLRGNAYHHVGFDLDKYIFDNEAITKINKKINYDDQCIYLGGGTKYSGQVVLKKDKIYFPDPDVEIDISDKIKLLAKNKGINLEGKMIDISNNETISHGLYNSNGSLIEGTKYNGDYTYSGSFEDDAFQSGWIKKNNILIKEGTFYPNLTLKNGKKYDNGILSYEGEFNKYGELSRGTKYVGNRKFIGKFKDQSLVDGQIYYSNVLTYQGTFDRDGKPLKCTINNINSLVKLVADWDRKRNLNAVNIISSMSYLIGYKMVYVVGLDRKRLTNVIAILTMKIPDRHNEIYQSEGRHSKMEYSRLTSLNNKIGPNQNYSQNDQAMSLPGGRNIGGEQVEGNGDMVAWEHTKKYCSRTVETLCVTFCGRLESVIEACELYEDGKASIESAFTYENNFPPFNYQVGKEKSVSLKYPSVGQGKCLNYIHFFLRPQTAIDYGFFSFNLDNRTNKVRKEEIVLSKRFDQLLG